MRLELIEEAKIASFGLKEKQIVKCNKEGILTESGESLTKDELAEVIKYRENKAVTVG